MTKVIHLGKKLFLMIFLIFQGLIAHGVDYRLFEGGVGIKVFYDDGSPMAYVDVTIFSPNDGEVEYQSGLTDKNGQFVFNPDADGTWKVIVNDGLGHGLIKELDLQEGILEEKAPNNALLRWQKIIIGCSLIFGITGFLYGYTIKKQRDGNGAHP